MANEVILNDFETQLAADIPSGTAVSFTVIAVPSPAPSGQFRVRVDNEYIIIGSVTGTTFNVAGGAAGRGVEGTTATAHSAPATVAAVVTAAAYQALSGTPSGAVIDFAGPSAPAGWLMCDGSAVSRATYSALFTAIGIVFGPGDGTTTFNIPDLRGRVSLGVGTSSAPGATAHALGQQGGEETHLLTIAEMPSHTHPPAGGGEFIVTGTGTAKNINNTSNNYGGQSATNPTGGGAAHNNLDPFTALNKIIKT